ncbi:disulfide bond formation protein B [Agaribacter flavus]|uniref:Disulfide bond formation protein B n=1 Tax=Agaribacter flavus TaxID=1902781 RepID=A0ABV7FMB2_9ALTE
MLCLLSWSKTKLPWLILFSVAFALVCSALYFHHILDHRPCVKCIYQRTAMIGIALSAALPLVYMHVSTRIIGLLAWLGLSLWGLSVAQSHVELIYFDGLFMPPCPIEPNFPSFMPLHHWFPDVFSATGQCNDNTWQFMSMGMAEWMRIIFGVFTLVSAAVSLSYLIRFRQVAK